jgi:ElaB/YqjD/DUF883 family membrane-anchored ribosome-binding protein
MAEKPEVIQHELEETRHALAEKLEQIGEKISGTVETVSETVSSVTETVGNVTEAMEGTVQAVAETVSNTVESVKDTVSAVGETASETVEAVKEAFNLSEQVRRHPWLWVGGSVAAGFIAGKLFGPRGERHTQEAWEFAQGRGYQPYDAEWQAPTGNGNGRSRISEPAEPAATESGTSSGMSGMLGGITQQFGPELNKLKELALGTLFGVARDMISRSLPQSLQEQVTHLFNDFTEKAGGKPIEGTVLDESDQEADSAKGAEHEPSGTTEMSRPGGAGERKGKATVGKSNRR